ncbi:MAG: Crp/Fnr family transcriptional regulator [Anaerolineaceae bacterium]|nr:Crp/Fnr family transcriptional regulator [Anaerolineaceae bacterium]
MAEDDYFENLLFSSLSQAELNYLSSKAIQRKLKKGEYLVMQGDHWPYIFLVKDGAIVAEKGSLDGRTFIAATFKVGEVFWGLDFFIDNTMMPANLFVHEDSEIIQWSRVDLMPLIESNGLFSWEICKLVVSRIQYASEVLETLTFQPIAVRLARLLMSISASEQQLSIERNLTLDEMAARIGTTREMVCRLLYRFSDEGIISISRTEFNITDNEKLSKRAQK